MVEKIICLKSAQNQFYVLKASNQMPKIHSFNISWGTTTTCCITFVGFCCTNCRMCTWNQKQGCPLPNTPDLEAGKSMTVTEVIKKDSILVEEKFCKSNNTTLSASLKCDSGSGDSASGVILDLGSRRPWLQYLAPYPWFS